MQSAPAPAGRVVAKHEQPPEADASPIYPGTPLASIPRATFARGTTRTGCVGRAGRGAVGAGLYADDRRRATRGDRLQSAAAPGLGVAVAGGGRAWVPARPEARLRATARVLRQAVRPIRPHAFQLRFKQAEACRVLPRGAAPPGRDDRARVRDLARRSAGEVRDRRQIMAHPAFGWLGSKG